MTDLTELRQSEAVVIAQCVRTRGAFLDEIECKPEDFITNEASWALTTIKEMLNAGEPIDSMSVGIRDPRVEVYVWRVADLPTHGAAFHADLVHEAAVRRRVLAVAEWTKQNHNTLEVASLIDGARARIDEAAGLRKQPLVYVGDVLDEIIEDAERPRTVYPGPWPGLNDILGGGFRPGALYVLGARPGIGKTALALQIASALADAGPVSFSSLEMPREEIVRRIIAQGVRMPHHLLEAGRPLPEVWKAKIEAWRERAPFSIAVDDRSGMSMSDVRAFARSVRRPSGRIAGVVFDYLQLMAGTPGFARHETVAEHTRQFKLMARELECPVILLSQLNRESEKRVDKRPTIADLRESGSIEQDADVVILPYRDPNDAQNDPYAPPLPVPLELIVAKNRHGPTLSHTVMWEGTQMRAYDGREDS